MSDETPEFDEEKMARFDLTPADMKAWMEAQAKIANGREQYQRWLTANGRDPKIEMKFDAKFEFTGISAVHLAFFQLMFVRTGAWDMGHFMRAVITAGVAALFDHHKRSGGIADFLASCGQLDPELTAQVAALHAYNSARMHKQIEREKFNELTHDLRDMKDVLPDSM